MTTHQEQAGTSARPPAGERPGWPAPLPGLCWFAGPHGAVESVGERWRDWTGQEPELALGEGWFDALHPDDAPRVRSLWRAAVASGCPFSARFRVGPGRDGRVRTLVARAEPVRDDLGRPACWNGLALPDPDVPEERALAAGDREEDFAIFWIAARDGARLVSVSPSCERLLGRPVAELTGRPCSWPELAHPEDRERVREGYARRASGHPTTLEYRLVRPDGSTARVRDRILPGLTRSMGDPDRIFGVLEDVELVPDAPSEGLGPGGDARLASLVEGIGDLFLGVDRDGRCVSANAQAAALLGVAREALLGRRLAELFPEPTGPAAEEHLRRARECREPVCFEAFSERAGLWLEFRAFPVGDHLAVLARDVTEARANRLALLEIEERFRLCTEAVPGLIYDWRVETGVVHRSPGLVTLLGFRPEETDPTERWWRDRIHPDDLPEFDRELRRLSTDPGCRQYRLDYRVRHRDGHDVEVWDQGFCIRDGDGRLVRVVGSTLDITDRRRAERALREADRRKNEFLGTLAHELRNPLGPILAAAQALRVGADDPRRELPAIIERQARHMARLVDDLLDVSRIDHGKIRLQPEPIDLVELVRQSLDAAAEVFREHRLTLRAELPDRPVPVRADPTRMAQCVGNLLQNASKFTEAGGEVTVRVEADGRSARVEVRDTGIGIRPEVLPTLFRPYWQAAQGLGRSRGGLGIGLALVRNLMEQQGGAAEAESGGEGLGSTFRLILPLLEVPAASAVDGRAADPEPPPAPGAPRPLRMLVVDDRADMAHLLGRLLRARGHRVTLASDAEEALRAARAERPDVVISDIGLPGPLDGYGLARSLRADPGTDPALLIAVTGYARPDDRLRALEAGFDEHLTKPIDFDALNRLLARLSDAGPSACRP